MKMVKKFNVDMKAVYWTAGPYDTVSIMEAQNETDLMAFPVAVQKLGFLTSEGIRLYNNSEREMS